MVSDNKPWEKFKENYKIWKKLVSGSRDGRSGLYQYTFRRQSKYYTKSVGNWFELQLGFICRPPAENSYLTIGTLKNTEIMTREITLCTNCVGINKADGTPRNLSTIRDIKIVTFFA